MGVDLFELETLINSKLIDGECFYATEWGLPEFFTEYVDISVDPTWHEFERVAYTDEPANTLLAVADFMERIEKANKIV